MPKIAIYKNLIFYLVSFDLQEKLHLQIFSKNSNRTGAAKIWLEPTEVFDKGDLTNAEVNMAVKLIESNKEKINELINNFKAGIKTKPLNF